MKSKDFDVIIIGGGGGGLSAAIMAKEAGASCIVLEADTKLGGATAWSGGVFYAAGTSVQRAAGIEGDTPQAMYDYIMTLAGWEANPKIFRILSEQSGAGLEWLIEMGVVFPPQYLVCSGVDTVPRGHPSQGLADALINTAGAKGVETALNTRVESLIVEDGRVVGVRAGGTELRAGAVVIATGGFGNSEEMIKRLYPTAAANGAWTYAVHFRSPYILGDGIKLGEAVGAEIVGHDTGLLLPTSGLGKFVEAFMPPWITLVNTDGRRFMDESAPYAVSGYLINAQPGQRAFAVFDEVALVEGSQDMRYADPYNSGGVAMPTWEYNLLRQSIDNGKIFKADTLRELAGKIGVYPEILEATAERYNADCDKGIDSDYFKEMPNRFPLRKAPFYAREVRACVIGQTGAGLNVNEQAQVLDRLGHTIPGLYAGGEVLGCAMGKRYSGGGMGICNAIVFGRIAGTAAATDAMKQA